MKFTLGGKSLNSKQVWTERQLFELAISRDESIDKKPDFSMECNATIKFLITSCYPVPDIPELLLKYHKSY